MPKLGRPKTDTAILAARGSWRAIAREKQRTAPPKPKAVAPEWKPLTKRKIDKLIASLPGYGPHVGAGDSWFDYKAGNTAIKFFETKLRHVEGAVAGKPFLLEDWEKAIILNLFGWKRKDDFGRIVRRYRECFIYIARKNGKTPLAAGICLYVLFEDKEPGAQIYSAAAERDQAALLYRHARGMVEQCPELSAKAQIYAGIGQRAIVLANDPASSYRVISADAYSKHGFNLHLGVMDELHAQPNRDLVDVLNTSMASANRAQPLMVYITTADYNRESICNEKHDYACKVRDGIIEDQAFLPVIFEALPNEDWTDPKVWAKANPNLGVSVSREYLERECKHAQETPTYENTFKRLHLNMKTEQDVRWLPMDRWDAHNPPDPLEWRRTALEDLAGLPCCGGLDLSTTQDITAFVLAFNIDSERIALPFFWIPKENAERRERRDRVPYLTWARQGFLTMTDGNVIDYDVVRRDIAELGQRFHIRKIARDRWNASQITNQLMGDGFEMEDFGQGFASMSAPCKELERLVIGGQLDHGGNPVLRWMAANAAAETDHAGNIKPSKKKSTERIDGIVALAMALGSAGQDISDSWGIIA